MTQEEKELLVSLLLKAEEEDSLHIWDNEDNTYFIDFISIDSQVCINIKNY